MLKTDAENDIAHYGYGPFGELLRATGPIKGKGGAAQHLTSAASSKTNCGGA
ncbi:MAG: hypothetical protein ABSF95_16390 [Verrucomicrobiota bacterium]|jgi:hypothetical protein